MSDLIIKHAGTEQAQDEHGPVNPEVKLGQAGSCLVTGTAIATCKNGVFAAITMLEDTVFTAIVAEDSTKYVNSVAAQTAISAANTDTTASETFPKGITIYGRWKSFTLASGLVMAYRG